MIEAQAKGILLSKNDFFSPSVLREIHKELSTLKFTNLRGIKDDGDPYKRYFSVTLPGEHFAVAETIKNLKELGLTTYHKNSFYFFSGKDIEADPHNDESVAKLNCLVYLRGQPLLNSGTGFYDKIGDSYELNSHIGFRENRAIIFDSKIYHTSLQFNKDSSGVRYVMANFLNYKPEEKIK
jgi:hypothetical protein